jgi:hypothetical protein
VTRQLIAVFDAAPPHAALSTKVMTESCEAVALGTLEPWRSSRVICSMVVRACWIAPAWDSTRGWLPMAAVNAVTAAPMITRPRAVATSSSGSVKPRSSAKVERARRRIQSISTQQPLLGGLALAALHSTNWLTA